MDGDPNSLRTSFGIIAHGEYMNNNNFTMEELTPYTPYPWIVQALLVRMKKSSSGVFICLWRFSVGMRLGRICIMSKAKLQKLSGMPESSVRTGLKDLVALGIIKRLNEETIQEAVWEIILPDPSNFDPSEFDPSFLDGDTPQILRRNPSNFDPHSYRIKEKKEKKKPSSSSNSKTKAAEYEAKVIEKLTRKHITHGNN
jgi:hypothetical protein